MVDLPLRRLPAAFFVFLLAACQPGGEGDASTTDDALMQSPAAEFDPVSATVVELQQQLASGELTALAVTEAYLARISELDDAGPRLNAVIQINPDARTIARALDEQLAAGAPAGPLHGIPVLLKANIDTADAMATSAGSLALKNHVAGADAYHVARLREAGAVILGKTNLSEWANFRDSNSSSGWSSLGGQTRNPHILDRNPCGSSSGSAAAVAASFAPLAIGTETNGSIVCPAGVNGIVGIKPTLGSVSRSGIIPIAHSQDTAGPMAKSVTGAALLLQAMIAYDPQDPGAVRFPGKSINLLPDVQQTDLNGRRIGIYRSYFGAGDFPRVEQIYADAIATLSSLGATLVDPISYTPPETKGNPQFDLLLYEFKNDLNQYLASHAIDPEINTLAKLIAWNEANAADVLSVFGQSIFLQAEAKGALTDEAYLAAKTGSVASMRDALDAIFEAHQLDALFIPVNGPAWKTDWIGGDRYSFGGTSSLAAVSGYPSIVLPAGNIEGLPIAVGFVGPAFSEDTLIQLAWTFEQAQPARIEPNFIPTLEQDSATSE